MIYNISNIQVDGICENGFDLLLFPQVFCIIRMRWRAKIFAAYRSGVQKKVRQIFAAYRSGVQKKVRKSSPRRCAGVFSLITREVSDSMTENDVRPGYVYHIKDLYFDIVQDDKLMKNHERGSYRPTYFCVKDEKTSLLWVIPMSTKVDKYRGFMQKDIERYGKCLKIVIGEYANVDAVFLLQNMFPILPRYIDHIHLINQNPVPVNTRLQIILNRNFREVLRLHRKGLKIVFPDIIRLERLMLDNLDSVP